MTRPSTYSFRRYLEAKRTVDDRSLNRRVEGLLREELHRLPSPVDVLEVGAGIGATIERVIRWDQLPDRVRYTAVERDPDLVGHICERLPENLTSGSTEVSRRNETLEIEHSGREITVEPVRGDVFEMLADSDRTWDLLIAQSFMDLVDVEAAIARFLDVLAPGGLLYFPLTFDGGTSFAPPIDPEFDDRLERRYHRHMDTRSGRDQGGGSRAGRQAIVSVPALGGELLTAGSSDWVVFPGAAGYPADEDYFLHHIVHTVRDALVDDPMLDSDRFTDWITTRHRQVENAELIYVAHQLDIVGLNPAPSASPDSGLV